MEPRIRVPSAPHTIIRFAQIPQLTTLNSNSPPILQVRLITLTIIMLVHIMDPMTIDLHQISPCPNSNQSTHPRGLKDAKSRR